jgi:hypothetical protein
MNHEDRKRVVLYAGPDTRGVSLAPMQSTQGRQRA